VGSLSRAGIDRFGALRARLPGPVRATVREVWVHLDRARDGTVKRTSLVVLPTLRLTGV
jgi:hypothetical protein